MIIINKFDDNEKSFASMHFLQIEPTQRTQHSKTYQFKQEIVAHVDQKGVVDFDEALAFTDVIGELKQISQK